MGVPKVSLWMSLWVSRGAPVGVPWISLQGTLQMSHGCSYGCPRGAQVLQGGVSRGHFSRGEVGEGSREKERSGVKMQEGCSCWRRDGKAGGDRDHAMSEWEGGIL